MRFEPMVTDEELVAKLKEFAPDVVYAFDPEADSVQASDFFMYAPTKILLPEEQRYLYQEMLIVHVSVHRDGNLEWEILEALQELGLYIREVQYDSTMLTDRQNRADVLAITVHRKVKDHMPSRVIRKAVL